MIILFLSCCFVFFCVIRGLWLVFNRRATQGLKHLACGLTPPIIFFTLAMTLFPACLEKDPRLSEWVSLKGKVVNVEGRPVAGTQVTLYPWYTARDDSYGFSQMKDILTDTNGTYELTGVKPLSLEMTAGYLVAPSAAVRRVPFFFGIINVNPGVDENNATPQLTVPLISENRLKLARRSIRYLGWPGRKEKDVWLPRSEGDVIFLPDIVIDSMDKKRCP